MCDACETHVTKDKNSFDRYFFILETLQVAPHYRTARDIQEILSREGDDVSVRQIQRILNYYADRFGLASRDKPNSAGRPPKEWAWIRKSGPPNLQPMDPPTALTFQLATQLLEPILPGAFLEQMEKELRRARKALVQTGAKARNFSKKVKVLPRGQGRMPAVVKPDILNNVYTALLSENRIRVSYLSQASETVGLATHELSPLGLVFRFDTFYLVHVREPKSKNQNPGTIMEWPLHRFQKIEVLEKKIRLPTDFDLDIHLQHPGFLQNRFLRKVFSLGPEIKLKLLFSEKTARYVRERPFSHDQVAKYQEDGRVLITAKAPNTRETLSELFNFADDVEVVSPKPLRDYFRKINLNLCQRYQR